MNAMNLIHTLFNWTLEVSLRASLLAGAVLLIQAALRGHLPARWRYALWLPVLLVLILPALPGSRWSAENVLTNNAPALGVAPAMEVESAAPMIVSENIALSQSVTDWAKLAGISWAMGTLAMLGLGLTSYHGALRRFQRLAVQPSASLLATVRALSITTGLRRAPALIVSHGVKSPAVAGVLRPVLLLPAAFERAFTPEEARLVLKHELMHLKRHDLQVNAVVCLLQAMHWFNPALWFAAARVRADRESACDAQVLASDQADCRNDYGHALLKVQTECCPGGLSLGLVGAIGSARLMRSRITAILNYRRSHPVMGVFAGALIGLLSLVGATRAETTAPAFEIGQSSFPFGDSIHIVSVQRDADFITVHGDYELVSQPKASLALFITTHDDRKTKVDPRQHLEVEKGKGTFTLVHPAPVPGMPHVTFYSLSTKGQPGKSFGGVYFGTKEEAESSKRMSLSQYKVNKAPALDSYAGLSTSNCVLGQTLFPFGDSIQITSVEGTAESLTVSGTYDLMSEEDAALTLYITAIDKAHARSKSDPRQRLEVKKGKGTFTLVHPALVPGMPHLTFYSTGEANHGHPFGGVYFGTQAMADTSKRMKLDYAQK